MNAVQIASLVGLAAAFFAATRWQVSLGIILLPAAFVIGTIGGVSSETIVAGFPTEMFLLLLGLTYLFTVVDASGAMNYIMDVLLRLVGQRQVLVPAVLFLVAAFTTGIGVYAVAVLALLIPIGMRFARQVGMSIFLISLIITHGMLAGLFSPISIDGVFVDRLLTDAGLPSEPLVLFVAHIAVHGLICFVAFLLFGGAKLFRRKRSSPLGTDTEGYTSTIGGSGLPGPGGTHSDGRGVTTTTAAPVDTMASPQNRRRPTMYEASAMSAVALLIACAVLTDFDLGLVALLLGAVLTLVFDRNNQELLSKVPWSVLMLIGGVLTYIAVMTEIGTLAVIGDALDSVGDPKLSVLIVSFFTAISSAFTSTLGVLGASLPMGAPMIEAGMSNLSVVGPITLSATMVDASPLGIGGAVILASALPEERQALFKKMGLWGLSMVLIGPILSWVAFTLL